MGRGGGGGGGGGVKVGNNLKMGNLHACSCVNMKAQEL